MSRSVYIGASIFEDPFFAGRAYGKVEAFLWLSQVWDRKNIHLIAGKLNWPKQNVWKFIRDMISHGLIDAERIQEVEQFYRKFARRSAIPVKVRDTVALRDGEKCRYCGDTSGPFHLDHVKPWSKGGEHRASNLVVACQPCNLKKKDKSLRELGWKL